jgi:hypothetical protein
MPAPQIRLTFGGDGGEGEHGKRVVHVDEVGGLGGTHRIGYLLVPEEAVPQLGALGVLVGLGVFSSLEFVGEGVPEVLKLEPRMIRLMKIAAKVLG